LVLLALKKGNDYRLMIIDFRYGAIVNKKGEAVLSTSLVYGAPVID
jgi:hypothetical protein